MPKKKAIKIEMEFPEEFEDVIVVENIKDQILNYKHNSIKEIQPSQKTFIRNFTWIGKKWQGKIKITEC